MLIILVKCLFIVILVQDGKCIEVNDQLYRLTKNPVLIGSYGSILGRHNESK